MKRSKQMRLTFSRDVVVKVANAKEQELIEALAELLLAAAGRGGGLDQRRDSDEPEADR
jgi:hypothetical protein